MAKVKVELKELSRLNRNLGILSKDAVKVAKFSLYDGATIAADELRTSVAGLSRVSDVAAIGAWKKGVPSLICVSQKNGLLNGLGVSKMKNQGASINLKVGFDGYNSIRTRRWPNGQPNIMIAASCEHGSSAMLEQPFIRAAYRRCAAQVRAKMEETAGQQISEILDK